MTKVLFNNLKLDGKVTDELVVL